MIYLPPSLAHLLAVDLQVLINISQACILSTVQALQILLQNQQECLQAMEGCEKKMTKGTIGRGDQGILEMEEAGVIYQQETYHAGLHGNGSS